MIYDSLENFMSYSALSPVVWEKIAAFLKNADPEKAASAELIPEILRVSIQRYATHDLQPDRMEYHRDFADIQLLLAGTETLYYAPLNGLPQTSAFDAKSDFGLVQIPEDALPLKLIPGNFALLLPNEAHAPGIGNGTPAVKAVIKIAVSAFR